MLKKICCVLTVVVLCVFAGAQERSPEAVNAAVRGYRQKNEAAIVSSYVKLLSIPNVASDRPNILANAEFISKLLEDRGFKTRALNVSGAPPVVYGELISPGASHTLLWYAHYDGQPVDKAQWASDPWTPMLRDGLVDG